LPSCRSAAEQGIPSGRHPDEFSVLAAAVNSIPRNTRAARVGRKTIRCASAGVLGLARPALACDLRPSKHRVIRNPWTGSRHPTLNRPLRGDDCIGHPAAFELTLDLGRQHPTVGDHFLVFVDDRPCRRIPTRGPSARCAGSAISGVQRQPHRGEIECKD